MSSLTITPVSAFSDNYIWLISRDDEAFVVDPGEHAPVEAALTQRGLSLSGILVTHHHFDHTGAVATLQQEAGCPTWGPAESPAGGFDYILREGDTADVLGVPFSVLEVPGHTLDHIAYFSAAERALFCGDTLFVGGCGRVFEGTPPQMRASLAKLLTLPGEARVFCAHEYTLANLAFAQLVEPANRDLSEFIADCVGKRERNIPTVPSLLADERRYNPFLRWDSAEIKSTLREAERLQADTPDDIFTAVREWKNNA